MAKSIKERLLERLPGTRSSSDEGRSAGAPVGAAQKVAGFFQEFKTEMKKVTWPGRKDTIASTAVVIVTVLVIVAFLGLVDFALGKVVQSILSY
jgi:preprotein translocase subunit SecE